MGLGKDAKEFGVCPVGSKQLLTYFELGRDRMKESELWEIMVMACAVQDGIGGTEGWRVGRLRRYSHRPPGGVRVSTGALETDSSCKVSW